MKKLKLGILGSGYLGSIIANACKNGLLDDYELICIAGRNKEKTDALAKEMGVKGVYSYKELVDMKPDYIAEAASVEGVKEFSIPALSKGINLVILSIGAFADEKFYEEVKSVAKENNAKVHIASGAVGGFDVLRTISLMGEAQCSFTARKGPNSLKNTPLFKDSLMSDKAESVPFDGTAKGAIELLPTKVNVAVASSLAMLGPDKTHVEIHSVPDFKGDEHIVKSQIDGVSAELKFYCNSAAIAGYSVVARLQNIASPIEF